MNPIRFSWFTLIHLALSLVVTAQLLQPASAVTPEDKQAPSILRTKGSDGIVTIGCVGDSITYGVGSSSQVNNYPSLLALLLGMGFTVDNFGESGATLLKNGDSPYWKRGSFKSSADADPNIIVIMLGANDSKPWNWSHKSEFYSDYSALIDYYAALSNHPKIYICSPCPVPGTGNYGINEPAVEEQITIIKQLVADKKVSFIDVHSVVPNDSAYFVDRVHPNDLGYQYLASAVYIGLTNSPAILPVSNTGITTPFQVTILPPSPGSVVRYTIDGSDPNRKSAVYSGPFTITAPATVKAEAFDGRRSHGLITSTSYFTTKP